MATTRPNNRRAHLYQVIKQYIEQHGHSPSVQDLEDLTKDPETGKGFSFGSIQHHLMKLEEEGLITKTKGLPRTIRLK